MVLLRDPGRLRLNCLTVNSEPFDSLLPLDVATYLKMLEATDLDERRFLLRVKLKRQDRPAPGVPCVVCRPGREAAG